jgi:hypothetical protein
MSRALCAAVALGGIAATVGCGPAVHDDIDVELDFSITASDSLHTPYVRGAVVTLSADLDDGADVRWTSDDAGVFRFDSVEGRMGHGVAAGAGSTTVRAWNGDDEAASAEVEVREPDGAALLAHGPLIVNSEALQARTLSEAEVLTSGTATFLVKYYAGDELLHGSGVLEVEADDDTEAASVQTFLFENQEWLQVTPKGSGRHVVSISASGVHLRDFVVNAVSMEDIDHLELYSTGEDGRDDGAQVTVLAQPVDHENRPVYGVEFGWDVDGEPAPGAGDLYRYTFDEDIPVRVTARQGSLSSSIDIHSNGGYVDSTNDLGCATAKAPRAPWPPALVVVAALLALGRRRDRRPSRGGRA